eukprot:TRINITY_DN95829_c0_g1_i1.p1 TRINITY_DN95829_c0_g1~~TRINITY_DN95829_c0_g1_i1.p1  ORF type:complete len:395 (+),score=38.16 TRINITY_DN95829_c0_g1_i1:127-1185(+)
MTDSKAQNEDEGVQVDIDIPEDAYGAGILAIVRDIVCIQEGPSWSDEEVQLKMIQASFALLLMTMNLGMQFSLLYFIYIYVVTPSVNHVQSQYGNFHAMAFDKDGVFQPDLWEKFPNKSELCQIGMSNPVFYCLVVFLWVLLIIREFRVTERLARDILVTVPSCERRANMCRQKDGKIQIIALTTSSRVLLVVCVVIPKFLICGVLMWLGCEWLTATTSFTDLVMNSIAMEFVTRIDENLYETILPVAHRNQVSEINFVVFQKNAGSRNKEFVAFKRSFVYLWLAVGFTLVYSRALQNFLPPDLSDLKEHCAGLSDHAATVCQTDWWKGSQGVEKCFPYGVPYTGLTASEEI